MTEQKEQKEVVENVDDQKKVDENADEKLLAGKFKSEEDLVNSYKELEREFTRVNQENSEWRQTVTSLVGERSQDKTDNTDDGEEVERFNQEFLSNPRRALENYGDRLAKSVISDVGRFITTRESVARFTDKHPEILEDPKRFADILSETSPKESIDDRLVNAKEEFDGQMKKIEEKIEKRRKQTEDFERKNRKKASDVGPGADDVPGKKKSKDEDDDDDSGSTYDDYISSRKKERARIMGLV